MLARAAVLETPLPHDWTAEIARGSTAQFPITAADLMPGLQGAALGERLKALESRWLESDLRLGSDDLLSD